MVSRIQFFVDKKQEIENNIEGIFRIKYKILPKDLKITFNDLNATMEIKVDLSKIIDPEFFKEISKHNPEWIVIENYSSKLVIPYKEFPLLCKIFFDNEKSVSVFMQSIIDSPTFQGNFEKPIQISRSETDRNRKGCF